MTMLMKTVSIFGVAAAVLAASVAPSSAMPIVPRAPAAQAAPANDANVVQVQYWRDRGGYRDGWYGGHRGYREYRPRHRYHDGYWYPLAAFGAGAIIGGALATPTYEPAPRYYDPPPRYYAPAPRYVAPPPRRYAAPASDINPQHHDWCLARYRSYDIYSNTFQPNYGPRKQCYSPYF